jgi:Spy/CpxP family protein refolding chaperone
MPGRIAGQSAMKFTRMLSRFAAALTIALVLASPAASQGFKWWQSDQYRKELRLTQEQSRVLEQIFQLALPTLKTQKKTLDKAEAEFEALVERGGDSAVMEQVNHVETARAELNKSRTMMLLRMRRVLTSEQWAKFTALHQAAEREAAERERGRPRERESK